jgi:hypothetical protein
MPTANHNLQLFWSAGKTAPELRAGGVDTNNPDDILAYQNEVDVLENLRDELRKTAQKATGAIHDLPQVEGAPRVIEKPWTTTEAGQRYVAWNVFAVANDGTEVALSKRLANIDGGVMWLEPMKSNQGVRRNTPPQENIDKGYRCDTCRRFSWEQGQTWLNQETHRFEKASSRMWRDVVELVAEKTDVEAPQSLEEFGACLEDEKLVPRDYPGCERYRPRKAWAKGVECLNTTATPEVEDGRQRSGP